MAIQAKLFVNQKSGPSSGSKITPGIHSDGDVTFLGVKVENSYIDFLFGSSDGRSIHKRVFHPSGNYPKDGETIEDALNREAEEVYRELTELMQVLLPAEFVSSFEAEDYKSYVDKAATALNQQKGLAVNLKVVVTKKKIDGEERTFPDLPRYGAVGFVEIHTGLGSDLKFSKKEQEKLEAYFRDIADKVS